MAEQAQPFAMLEKSDRLTVVRGIMAKAGPDGMHEDEIERQATILSEWVIQTEIATALLKMMRDGEVRAFVNAEGTIQYERVA